ncbi:MAG TPA: hypothetical protein PLN69_03240 [bacterium]|nr:hypothetical protein [bacterium]
MIKKMFTVLSGVAFLTLISVSTFAAPGPVFLTFMERYEWHSDVSSIDNPSLYEENSYLYSMVSAFRKLDDNIFGNVFYLNKFDLDDSETASHIGGVSLTHNMTNKWRMSYTYSHNSNPERNVVTSPESRTDRFSFSLGFKLNPGEKTGPKYALRTTFSTGTDFSFGRTLSEKVSMSNDINKRMKYDLSYQFVWGLTDAPDRGIFKSHFANQWLANLTYKLSNTKKISLEYMFLNNLYHGAVTDDNILRLSFFWTL